MFIRGTRVETPPDKMDQAIANFQSQVIPSARPAPGYLGAVLLGDRATGAGIALTYWESAEALAASEQVGIETRTQAAKSVPGMRIVNVERYEVVLLDRAAPPKAGVFAKVNTVSGRPAKIDAAIDFMRRNALPVLKAMKGYRMTIVAVDRQTGRSIVSTAWDTREDLEASESTTKPLREELGRVASGGPGNVRLEVFEVPVVEMTEAAVAAIPG